MAIGRGTRIPGAIGVSPGFAFITTDRDKVEWSISSPESRVKLFVVNGLAGTTKKPGERRDARRARLRRGSSMSLTPKFDSILGASQPASNHKARRPPRFVLVLFSFPTKAAGRVGARERAGRFAWGRPSRARSPTDTGATSTASHEMKAEDVSSFLSLDAPTPRGGDKSR